MNAKEDSPCAFHCLGIASCSSIAHSNNATYTQSISTMDLTETTLPKGQIYLRKRSDWPAWLSQLRFACIDKDVWDLINPDLSYDVAPTKDTEPTYPSVPKHPGPEPNSDADDHKQWKAQLETYKIAKETYTEELNLYKVRMGKWTRESTKIAGVRDWIVKTVSPDIMRTTYLKMENAGKTTPQALLRILKKDYAPQDGSTAVAVRMQYRSHLEKTKGGRVNPENWFNDWQNLY